MLDSIWSHNTKLKILSDNVGGATLGLDIYFQGKWAHGTWPSNFIEKGLLSIITFLELFPIVSVIMTWGSRLMNKRVIFNSENAAAVHILNIETSKSPEVMVLIRKLVLETLKHNTVTKGHSVEGKCNSVADSV